MRSVRFFCIAVIAASLLRCGHDKDGPTPEQGAEQPPVDPPAVCIEQLTTTVTVHGSGLSPMATKTMEDQPQLALPRVELLRTQDLSGGSATSAPVTIPDDPAAPNESRLRWLSQEKMSFEVFPELGLETGLYTVQVTNPNDNTGQWADALLAVPRPQATKISPDILCAAKQSSFTISGSTFIKNGTSLPRVTATPKQGGGDPIELTPAKLDKCRQLPGASGIEACDELIVDLKSGELPSGDVYLNYEIKVTNPDPIGCHSTDALVLTMVPAPELTKLDPEVICTAQGDNQITITGTGFLTIDGVTPTLAFDAKTYTTTASSCTAIPGPAATVESCTTLTATVQKADLDPATYTVSVTNPAPADCVTSNTLSFAVVPPPKVLAVKPDIICNAQADTTVVVEGSGFLSITDATTGTVALPTVSIGSATFTPVLSGCTTISGLVSKVETCTHATVTVPMGTLNPGSYDVKVTNPAPADCYSEDQVTLTVVPPPDITDITPDIVCPAGSGAQVTITGTGFLVIDGTGPSVEVGGATLGASASDCTAVVGPTETVESCTTLTVTIPSTVATGLQKLTVTNPSPAGCVTAEAPIYIAEAPVLTALQPPDICSALASTTLVLSGGGFLSIDGVSPVVTIGGQSFPTTASGCTAVTGLSQTLEVCTTLTFTVTQGTLSEGSHAVAVTNPLPADCVSSATLTLEVVPPPTITSVAPTKICAGGGVLTISGTGFRSGATVTLAGQPADSVTVTSATEITAAFGASVLSVGGPYDVAVTNPDGCSATKAAIVTIVPGPQLFFADPPVVYNGISTQITLYGSGFTGSVSFVGIRLSGSTDAPISLSYTQPKANQVQAVVPAATPAGDYDIILLDQTTCDATLASGLKVVDQVTLSLTAIIPPFGHTGSTTAVTVTADSSVGGGFQPVPRLYLNPSATSSSSEAAALTAVAFVDSSSVSAIVPKGLPVATYDLIAVNPDGGVGLLQDAFEVTQLPPPTLTNITPGAIANGSAEDVKVTGQNFRQPSALLRCLDAGTGAIIENTPVVNTFTGTEVNLVVNASSFINGAVCVVRIINGDDDTYGELSSLVITNPAQKLTAFADGPSLSTGRRALAGAANQATSAARFIYAIGGDSGPSSSALDTVEVAPVDIFGKPGAFFTQTYKLSTPRSYILAASLGRCIYVAGGINGTTVLDTAERACVLDPLETPDIVDLDLKVVPSGGGLGAGLWYYQVAAQMPADHASNPGGETLPSEAFPLLLPALTGKKIEVTVHWSQVSGAVGYRIYRSPAAGAAADALQLIATVNGETTTQYTDAGVAAQSDKPLRLGATGKWHELPSKLSTPRQGAGVAIAPDPADTTGTQYQLYIIGGKSATAALSSYEMLPLTVNPDGSQTAGTFSVGSVSLNAARWQLAAFSVGNDVASYITPPTHYIYAAGGVATNGTTMVGNVDALEVQAGGALKAPVAVDPMNPTRAGCGYAAANNFLLVFGGKQAMQDATATQAKICSADNCPSGPPALVNWSNASVNLSVARYLMGSARQSGFIYIIGGQTSQTGTTTSSTEYTIW